MEPIGAMPRLDEYDYSRTATELLWLYLSPLLKV